MTEEQIYVIGKDIADELVKEGLCVSIPPQLSPVIHKMSNKITKLEKKLDIALSHLGQIAIHSDNRVDVVQAAMAIAEIEEVK